jgi:hypothetical protein
MQEECVNRKNENSLVTLFPPAYFIFIPRPLGIGAVCESPMAKFRGNPVPGQVRQGVVSFASRPFVENEQLPFLMCDLRFISCGRRILPVLKIKELRNQQSRRQDLP